MISRSDSLPQVEQLRVGDELTPNGSEHDGGGELAVYPFPHDALEAHRCGHEAEANERDGVVPGRAGSVGSYASLTGLPDRERGGHREECLDHRSCVCMVKANEKANVFFFFRWEEKYRHDVGMERGRK